MITYPEYTEEEKLEHRRTWLAALRSGTYQQSRQRLKYAGVGFCCLGVACDLSGLGHWDNEVFVTETDRFEKLWPVDVSRYFGVGNSLDLPCRPQTMLSSMNDVGMTFSQIADLIEWYYGA